MANLRPDPSVREEKSLEKREAILAAALDEFSARGFAATRIEDIARRAGVAKGSVHFHFKDKQALFEALMRAIVGRHAGQIGAAKPLAGESIRSMMERTVLPMVPALADGKVGQVIRLLISEASRSPRLAEFYLRDVVQPALASFRQIAVLAVERGELPGDTLVRWPHLFAAPSMLIVAWTAIFRSLAPLDAEGLVKAHLDILFGPAPNGR